MKPRPSTPAMWYDANGYRWGLLGPNGEQLDQAGDPLPEEKPSLTWVLVLLVFLMFASIMLVSMWWTGAFDAGTPAVNPTTYGYPCEVK